MNPKTHVMCASCWNQRGMRGTHPEGERRTDLPRAWALDGRVEGWCCYCGAATSYGAWVRTQFADGAPNACKVPNPCAGGQSWGGNRVGGGK